MIGGLQKPLMVGYVVGNDARGELRIFTSINIAIRDTALNMRAKNFAKGIPEQMEHFKSKEHISMLHSLVRFGSSEEWGGKEDA